MTLIRSNRRIIVRRLPPDITEDSFYDLILPFSKSINYRSFHSGKKKENKIVPSTAYLSFLDDNSLRKFVESFDGRQFLDKEGKPHDVVIELCPLQQIPSQTENIRPRVKSLEEDESFIVFRKSVDDSKAATKGLRLPVSSPSNSAQSAPLVSALSNLLIKPPKKIPVKTTPTAPNMNEKKPAITFRNDSLPKETSGRTTKGNHAKSTKKDSLIETAPKRDLTAKKLKRNKPTKPTTKDEDARKASSVA